MALDLRRGASTCIECQYFDCYNSQLHLEIRKLEPKLAKHPEV